MTRKKATRREPTEREEGQQILESAAKAGTDYAQEQLSGDYFRDWIYEQMLEAERMRQADPDSVFPTDTPSGARKAARNMLQQLEWDTKRDMDASTVLELSGAKGVFDVGSDLDRYGITYEEVSDAFFGAFVEELRSQNVRQWLADMILEFNEEVRKGEGVSEARRAGRHVTRDSSAAVHWERSGGGVGWRGTGESGQTYLLRSAGGTRWALYIHGAKSGPFDSLATAKGEAERREQVATNSEMREQTQVYDGFGRTLKVGDKVTEIAVGTLQRTVTRVTTDAVTAVDKYGGRKTLRPHQWKRWGTHFHVPQEPATTFVRDYEAVDHRGRPIAGPFTDYSKAKREADRAGGYVKYASSRGARERQHRSR